MEGEKSREDCKDVVGGFAPPGFGLGMEERVSCEELRRGGFLKKRKVATGGGGGRGEGGG